MFYLSQILNSKVEDSADEMVGRLSDLLIKPKAGEYSPLVYAVIKSRNKHFFIPYNQIEVLSPSEVSLKVLKSKIEETGINENDFTFLKRDVLDQQIVDIKGARVVRVNDLKLGIFEEKMSVIGIDVSSKGLFRRLGVASLDFLDLLKVNLIDWRNAQPVKGTLKLDTLSKDLKKLHAADLANIIEDLNVSHGSRLVRSLDIKEAAKVIEEMDPSLQKILISHLGPEKATKIIEKMSSDEIVDLLQLLPAAQANQYLKRLQGGRLKKVQGLLEYEDDTAGGLMTTDFVVAEPDWSVERAVEEIRSASPGLRSILFIYVVDENGKFLGPASLRNLLLADKNKKMRDLLKPVDTLVTLKPENDMKEMVEIMTKYDLYTVAVLDNNGKLLGVVAIDDVMRQIAPEA